MMTAVNESETRGGEVPTRKPQARNLPEVPKGTPESQYPRRMNCATAAQLLGISVSHLRHVTAADKCPAAIRHRRRVTYDRDLLLAWNVRA